MHIDWSTFALQTVNFLILVWLLQRFLYRPVVAVIARRRDEIQRLVADADREKAAVEEQKRQLDDARAGAANERNRLLTEAREQAMTEKERDLAAARDEAAKIVADARARLEVERLAAIGQLQTQATRLGVALAQRLLSQTRPADPVDPFFGRTLAAIDGLPADERVRLARQAAADGLVLASAVPLSQATQKDCAARLEPLFGQAMKLDFVVEPALLAGIELRLPNLVMGDNWRDSLAAADAALSSDDRPSPGA